MHAGETAKVDVLGIMAEHFQEGPAACVAALDRILGRKDDFDRSPLSVEGVRAKVRATGDSPAGS
jgi:hypothetical protein